MYTLTILLIILFLYTLYKYIKYPTPQVGDLWIVNDDLCRVLWVDDNKVKFEFVISKEVRVYNLILFKLFSLPF